MRSREEPKRAGGSVDADTSHRPGSTGRIPHEIGQVGDRSTDGRIDKEVARRQKWPSTVSAEHPVQHLYIEVVADCAYAGGDRLRLGWPYVQFHEVLANEQASSDGGELVAERESSDTGPRQELGDPRSKTTASPHNGVYTNQMAGGAPSVASVRRLGALLGDVAPLDRGLEESVGDFDRTARREPLTKHVSYPTRHPSRHEMPRQIGTISERGDRQEEVGGAP